MKKIYTLLLLSLSLYSCKDDAQVDDLPNLYERKMAGGATTVITNSSNAYSFPANNLSPEELALHLEGDLIFESVFVSAPNNVNEGLGPIFNNSSCISCHPRDGRAAIPTDLSVRSGFFLRVSLPGVATNGGPVPVPDFGLQIQNHALFGYQPEAVFDVSYEYFHETLADGTNVEMRRPTYYLRQPYKPLPSNILISPRVGTPMFGLGLLELIPEQHILANADEHDTDGDGISGRPNWVYDAVSQQTKLGRFGWKANTATLLEQCAGAFVHDMGVTNPLFPIETGAGQSSGNDGRSDDPEIDDETLNAVTFYAQSLAVPASRFYDDREVRRGAKLFEQLQCAKCHIPKQMTGYSPVAALSYQTIYPYTDMLLHDMGEGLADHRPDFLANGREWKTRPLWGIGFQQLVNGHTQFLHDGRARNLTEAILWHGGEAQSSKEAFTKLSKNEREALLRFLNSL